MWTGTAPVVDSRKGTRRPGKCQALTFFLRRNTTGFRWKPGIAEEILDTTSFGSLIPLTSFEVYRLPFVSEETRRSSMVLDCMGSNKSWVTSCECCLAHDHCEPWKTVDFIFVFEPGKHSSISSVEYLLSVHDRKHIALI